MSFNDIGFLKAPISKLLFKQQLELLTCHLNVNNIKKYNKYKRENINYLHYNQPFEACCPYFKLF